MIGTFICNSMLVKSANKNSLNCKVDYVLTRCSEIYRVLRGQSIDDPWKQSNNMNFVYPLRQTGYKGNSRAQQLAFLFKEFKHKTYTKDSLFDANTNSIDKKTKSLRCRISLLTTNLTISRMVVTINDQSPE